MTFSFPSAEQFQAASSQLPHFECPEPNKAAFESVFDGSATLAEALEFSNENLASGLYLAGLLLKSCNDLKDYVVHDGNLSQFKIEGTDVRVVCGNLTVKGGLNFNHPLIVLGNLVIEGLYDDVGYESATAILGDLVCQNMRTTAWMIVGGDTKVEHFFYGHYNDDSFECIGTLSAQAVLTEEHQILPGRFVVQHMPPEGAFCEEEVFDTRNSKDCQYLLDIWDENLAQVVDIEEIRESIG